MNSEPIPSSIVKAITTIMASVDAVAKSQKNTHAGFMFSSTDDIYAAVARKMGEVGLTCLALERECEIARIERDGKTVQWLHAAYQFVLATSDDTWTDPSFKRSVYTQVTGPQSFQAAQSYCEKSFLRSLFKLPSGDMDLDSIAQGDTEEDQAALNGKTKRKSSYSAKKDGVTTETFNEIRGHITSAYGDRTRLMEIKTLYAAEWQVMPAKWAQILDDEYEDAIGSSREAAE